MKEGVIKRIVPDRGFGFIFGDDKKQYFFHKSMMSDRAQWRNLQVGQRMRFRSVSGKKGVEAHSVVPGEKPTSFNSISDIPGVYGLISISRGHYTDRNKNLDNCDGLAFQGHRTFGGRFPKDDKMISILRDMRAVFDRENKIWFLPAVKVSKNFIKISNLIRESKKQMRAKMIKSVISGLATIIFVLFIGSLLIMGAGIIILLVIGGLSGFLNGAKVSRTGNIWVAGRRIT